MREFAGTEIVMGISVGMLIFGLFDGGLTFAIVFCLLKARFKGKKIGRILGTVLGIILFSVYIALFVYFNTPGTNVNPDFRTFIYLAPIVLAVLLCTLVFLSQPPKEQNTVEAPEDELIADTAETEEIL